MEGSVRPHLLPRALGQGVRGSGGGSLGAMLWPRLWLLRFGLTNWLLYPFPGPGGASPLPGYPSGTTRQLSSWGHSKGPGLTSGSSLSELPGDHVAAGEAGLLSWEHGGQGLSDPQPLD